MINYFVQIFFIAIILSACDKNVTAPITSDKDLEVNIIDFNHNIGLGWKNHSIAEVFYTVENKGAEKIEGWEIAFYVYLSNGDILEPGRTVNYLLDSGSVSHRQTVSVPVPTHGRPTNVRLKYIVKNS